MQFKLDLVKINGKPYFLTRILAVSDHSSSVKLQSVIKKCQKHLEYAVNLNHQGWQQIIDIQSPVPENG